MDDANEERMERQYRALYHRYSHIGCPAAKMEDNCGRPDECAELGRCRRLPPLRDEGDVGDAN